MRLNSRAWCDGERKRENDLLQHSDILDTSNMILKIVCNFCVGISNTARPLCVCVCARARACLFFLINVVFALSTQPVFTWNRIG